MNENLAYQEEPREELLGGEIVMMASPTVNHYQITFNIVVALQSYLKGKTGIHGAPDLIVEVLSPGTAKNDRGYKKDLYEAAGVKEYWIVDPVLRSIEAYLLSDGKFVLDEVYALYPAEVGFTDKERKETKKEIHVSLYNDFCISLEEIFDNLF